MFSHLIPDSAEAHAAPDDRARFLRLLATALATGSLVRLSLSRYRGAEAGLERLLARPLLLRGEPHLQFVWRHATKDVTKNHPNAQALDLLQGLVGADFLHAHMDTATQEVQLASRVKGGELRHRLQVGKRASPVAAPAAVPAAVPAAAWAAKTDGSDADPMADEDDAARGSGPGDAAVPAPHNRVKQRPLSLAEPCWVDLGLATADGRLVPSMARKWKQINRFTEIFAGALEAAGLAGQPAVRVVDYGCGKGYLTFAMHLWLRHCGQQARVTGVELRPDLVDTCNAAARRHGHEGLRFDAGDLRSHAAEPTDVMVALHACDTATDHAIHLGLQAGAAVILCSPCCHKQLRPQMRTPPMLRPMLQHGVHLGQEAEMVTDSLRALLLDAAGYDTQVFEFVSLAHTNKNKMILAVRRTQQRPGHAEAVREQIAQIKAFYGIREQCLETLLQAPACSMPAVS